MPNIDAGLHCPVYGRPPAEMACAHTGDEDADDRRGPDYCLSYAIPLGLAFWAAIGLAGAAAWMWLS